MKVITFLLSFLVVGLLLADEIADLDNQMNATQKAQAIDMEKQVMAACCFGGTLHDHGLNDYTKEEKIEIRQLVLKGKTDDQILDYFRHKIDPRTGMPYGDRILAAPNSKELLGQVSYWMIAVFVIVGALVLWYALKKLLGRRVAKVEKTTGPQDNQQILAKVEKELKALDQD